MKVYAETDHTAQITGTLGGLAISERAPLDSVVQHFNITHGVNLLLANFVARKGFRKVGPFARFLLSGRVGAGGHNSTRVKRSSRVSNAEHYQVGRPAWQADAGLEPGFCGGCTLTLKSSTRAHAKTSTSLKELPNP